MSGLEVVALVAGIVSAFTGAGTLFRNWRRDRKERRKQEKNQRLEQTLVKGSSDVQTTYNDDFRRLGPMFARGDDISRSTLAEQLIKLQGTVISILTGQTPIGALIYPQHDLLSDTSIAVRLRSLSALAEQYQRMSQAAPISAPPAMKLIKDCNGALSFQSDDSWSPAWQCSRCKWIAYPWDYLPSHIPCGQIFLEYFHAKGENLRYCCALCDVKPLRDGDDMQKHLKDAHGYDVWEDARNNKDGCHYHRLATLLLADKTKGTANRHPAP